MSKLTTLGQREIFENAKALLAANGYGVEQAKLTQSQIRSEVAMSTSVTRFKFPITVGDNVNGNAFPTEKRLQLQDVFIVSAIALAVAKPASATDGMFDIFTYSNLTTFAATNTANSVRGAYANGNLSMIVDNDQVLPYLPTNILYCAPRTQQGTNTGYTASAVNLVDSRDGANDSIFQIEPNLILAGNAQIDVNLNLPSALTAIETGSRFILLAYGLLAQNCTKVANR